MSKYADTTAYSDSNANADGLANIYCLANAYSLFQRDVLALAATINPPDIRFSNADAKRLT